MVESKRFTVVVVFLLVTLTVTCAQSNSETISTKSVQSLTDKKLDTKLSNPSELKGTSPKTLGLGALGKGVSATKQVPVSTVAIFTLLMAAATGLGAIPFFFFSLEPAWQGICNGIACGVMLAASFDLVVEGQAHGGGFCVVLGILLGGLFIFISQKVLESYGDVKVMELKGVDAHKMILIVAIMTLHSFGEGSGVGVSFAGPKGYSQGLLVTIAIAVHNIPEGLAVSMVMASRGVPPREAMLWSIFTSLPQPLVAVPAFISAEIFNQFLPICVGFAAGCMIWMVFGEVMPDSFKDANPSHVASAATISVAVMEGVGTLLQGLESPPSFTNAGPMLYSLLFVLGPFLGGLLLVLTKSALPLHSTFLTGLSSGIMLILGLWQPTHLWLSHKMNFFAVLGLLYGGAFVYLGIARIIKKGVLGSKSKGKSHPGELVAASKNLPMSPIAKATLLACGAIVFQAFTEGLILGVAAPHAEGLGMYMLLPVALHGLPRGVAVAAAMFGSSKSGSSALMAAALTGLAGPVGAWTALLGGLDYKGLDYWMVLACGALIPAVGSDLLPRSLGLDKTRTWLGLILGVIMVVTSFSGTRALCMYTSYCNSAPEAVT